MISIHPYLTFDQNCEEAFNFYRTVFGGEYEALIRFKEMEPDGPAEYSNLIMHIALPIGKEMLMGSDRPGFMGSSLFGNNFSITVSVDSKEDADRIFKGLSAGGKEDMPIGTAPWGAYFGMLTDKFKIQWMISFDSREK